MLHSLRRRVRTALRYKLLTLVLLPLLCALAITLGYSLYRLNAFALESLYTAARNDLAVARAALRQAQDEQLSELQQLSDAPGFRELLRRRDGPAIQRTLQRLRDAKGYAFLHLTGVAGNWLHEPERTDPGSSKPSPLTDRAARGLGGTAFELFRGEDLQREDPAVAGRARLVRDGTVIEDRALVLRAVQPIADTQGRVSAMLDGGVLINHNSVLLDSILGRIFTSEMLLTGVEPVVSLLLDGRPIATARRSRAVAAGAAPEVSARVVGSGETWVGRENLAEGRFISAYGPLFDVHGQRVGMLHVGFAASAASAPHYRAVAALVGLFAGVMLLVAWITIRGLRRQLQPLETMAGVVRAIQAGEDRRIGPIGSRDEVGELARQFDAMLDLLAARNREIRGVADALEVKVAERTQELTRNNLELEHSIRELERMRGQLVRAEKLSALGQMAAGIAHELNNPAAVILGNIQLLEAELGDRAVPVASEIRHIAQQVERIRHIVTSLLQFASPAPSPGKVEAVDLNTVVADVAPLVKDLLRQKRIVLRRKLAAQTPARANVFDLEQILINLVVNAANAVVPGGTIEIATADTDDGGVEIRVRDDGPGIAPEHQARIFDPFFTTDPRRGAGLGLSVSYGLAQRHGGKITVESGPGRGSLFRLWLPRRAPETGSLESSPPAGGPHHVHPDDRRGNPESRGPKVPEESRNRVATGDRAGAARRGANGRAAARRARARAHDARTRRPRPEPRD